MSDKRWKRCEREIAKILGGKRVPVTGRSRGSAPDIVHTRLAIECKSRESVPGWLKEAMAQAVASVRGEQLPVAVIHEVNSKYEDALIMFRLGDFIKWVEKV